MPFALLIIKNLPLFAHYSGNSWRRFYSPHRPSFDLDVRSTDYLRPLVALGTYEAGKMLGGVAHRNGAQAQQPVMHCAHVQNTHDLPIQPVDDFPGRLSGG